MDHRDFDRLARLLGSGQSRRRVLKTLVGGTIGALTAAIGLSGADAAKLRSAGNSCNANSDCASNLCVQEARTRKICHCRSVTDCPNGDLCHPTSCSSGACVAGTPVVCTASDQCHNDGACNPSTGVCSNPAKPNGTPCEDGNLCTLGDVCQNGACISGPPQTCTALDQCHDVGTCNPQTGVCSNPPKANGAACNDGNACTQTDACQSGVCVGSNPVVCPAPADQCHAAGTCDSSTGTCSNPEEPKGTECSDGNPLCFGGACCPSGYQFVHGGCFEITGIGQHNCSSACTNGYGSVDGSFNYLCGHGTSTGCSTSANCPSGQACFQDGGRYCIAPC